MNVKHLGIGAAVLVAGVLGAVVGFVAARSPAAPPAAPVPAPKPVVDRAETARLQERVQRLEGEQRTLTEDLRRAKERAERAEAALAKADAAQVKRPDSPTPGPKPGPSGTAAPSTEPSFLPEAHAAVLRDVDWAAIGANMSAMTPLLESLLASMNAGTPPSPEDIGKIQQHNGPLVTAALKLGDRLPGTSPNGKFTHPAFMGNAIAATLAAAGKPLTADQSAGLGRLATEFSAEDERRLGAYDDRTYELHKLVEEADLRRRFLDAAMALLTEEQRTKLRPPATRDRLQADLFSAGLLLAVYARPLRFADDATLAARIEGALRVDVGWPADWTEAAQAIIGESIAAAPPDSEPADALSLQGMMTVPQAMDAARRQLSLLYSLAERLPLDAEAAERARASQAFLVPLRAAP